MVDVVTSPETARNSYATIAEADAYHDARLHVEAWTSASDAVKSAALVWASQILDDGYEWYGSQTYPNEAQRMRFPRAGLLDRDQNQLDDYEIPQALKNATSEQARLLIEADRGADPDTKGFESIAVGSIDLGIDKEDQPALIPFAVERQIDFLGVRINEKSSGFSQVPVVRS